MPARLSVFLPELPVCRFSLAEGQEYTLGRASTCELVVVDPRVSRGHVRLSEADGVWTLTDLGSKNGTRVEGQPIEEEVPLENKNWVSFGGLLARFELLSAAEQLAEGERERQRWATSLHLQKRLDPAAGLEELLQRLLGSVLEISEAERALVMLTTDDGSLELATSTGLSENEIEQPRFAASLGAVHRALGSRKPVVLSDALEDEGLRQRASILDGKIRALVCLPLLVVDRVIGVIYGDSHRPGSAFTEIDVDLLNALASHAALAIGVAKLHDELSSVREAISPATEAATNAWDRSLPAYQAPDEPPTDETQHRRFGDSVITRTNPTLGSKR